MQSTDRKSRTGTRKSSRGYRPRSRNALYTLASEFKKNQPKATAADAWAHFADLAAAGHHPVLVAFDPAAGLSYHRDHEKLAVTTVKRRSFEQVFYRL